MLFVLFNQKNLYVLFFALSFPVGFGFVYSVHFRSVSSYYFILDRLRQKVLFRTFCIFFLNVICFYSSDIIPPLLAMDSHKNWSWSGEKQVCDENYDYSYVYIYVSTFMCLFVRVSFSVCFMLYFSFIVIQEINK